MLLVFVFSPEMMIGVTVPMRLPNFILYARGSVLIPKLTA
jgi:hypothetical protein